MRQPARGSNLSFAEISIKCNFSSVFRTLDLSPVAALISREASVIL